MTTLEIINSALRDAEPNILGHRYAKVEVNGSVYTASSRTASSHFSAAHWGRVDYKKDGKKIAKANIK